MKNLGLCMRVGKKLTVRMGLTKNHTACIEATLFLDQTNTLLHAFG